MMICSAVNRFRAILASFLKPKILTFNLDTRFRGARSLIDRNQLISSDLIKVEIINHYLCVPKQGVFV